MSKLKYLAVVAIGAALLVVVIGTQQNVSADEYDPVVLTDEEIREFAIQSYMEDYPVSYDEAARRIDIMAQADSFIDEVESQGYGTYADIYLVHEPEFQIIAQFSSPNGETILAPHLDGIDWSDVVEVVEVEFSLQELDIMKDEVQSYMIATDIEFATEFDPAKNNIAIVVFNQEDYDTLVESWPFPNVYLDVDPHARGW